MSVGLLVTGMILFIAVHCFTFFRVIRARIVAMTGTLVFRLGFGLMALLSISLIIYGKSNAPYVALWQVPIWTRHVTFTMMFLAVLIFSTLFVPCRMRRLFYKPVIWAVAVWSLAHLCNHGDLASMILFGGFLIFSCLGLVALRPSGDAGTQSRPVSVMMDLSWFLVSCMLYGLLLFLHAHVIGRPLLPLLTG